MFSKKNNKKRKRHQSEIKSEYQITSDAKSSFGSVLSLILDKLTQQRWQTINFVEKTHKGEREFWVMQLVLDFNDSIFVHMHRNKEERKGHFFSILYQLINTAQEQIEKECGRDHNYTKYQVNLSCFLHNQINIEFRRQILDREKEKNEGFELGFITEFSRILNKYFSDLVASFQYCPINKTWLQRLKNKKNAKHSYTTFTNKDTVMYKIDNGSGSVIAHTLASLADWQGILADESTSSTAKIEFISLSEKTRSIPYQGDPNIANLIIGEKKTVERFIASIVPEFEIITRNMQLAQHLKELGIFTVINLPAPLLEIVADYASYPILPKPN